jgi:micrococcal nuclease
MRFITLFFGLALVAPAHAHKVIGIADGDTLTLLVDAKPLKIRLANIDAPEKVQSFGERSKQSLSDLCFGKDASYKEQDIDRYGRTVAVVTCGGVEVNRAQIELGMAWVYPKYNKDLTLPGLEAMARKVGRGLWSDAAPTPPWEFRRPKFKKVSAASSKASVEGICFVDQRGEYQFVDGRKRYGCSSVSVTTRPSAEAGS